MPKVTGKAVFDSIDNLLINFAGKYQSNLFMDELSMLIVKHFNLNIDLSVAPEEKFNNLKMFDFINPGIAPIDYSTMSNRQAKRLKYYKFQFLFKRNSSFACRQALDGESSAGDIDPSSIESFWSNVFQARTGCDASSPC